MEQMELTSSGRDERVQRAFATALEMQRKSEEEAGALKSELERTARSNKEEINALLEQVGRRNAIILNINMNNSGKSDHFKLYALFLHLFL